jgi:hypothetical protein
LEALLGDHRRSQQEQQREPLTDTTNTTEQEVSAEMAAEDSQEISAVVHAAKKFVCTHLLWLPVGHEDAVFEASEADDYNPLERLQPQNRIQGAFRDILDVLPPVYRNSDDLQGWIRPHVRLFPVKVILINLIVNTV